MSSVCLRLLSATDEDTGTIPLLSESPRATFPKFPDHKIDLDAYLKNKQELGI